jgi:hypothetical protein
LDDAERINPQISSGIQFLQLRQKVDALRERFTYRTPNWVATIIASWKFLGILDTANPAFNSA